MSDVTYISANGTEFVWDTDKAASNLKKHGVSFEDAASAFSDQDGFSEPDLEHSTDDETRFNLIGIARSLRLLTVCHCFREPTGIIRPISARKANKKEEKRYINHRGW